MPKRPTPDPVAAELAALAPGLDAVTVPEPSDALVALTLERAAAELARDAQPSLAHRIIPVGFKRELARLFAASALPLALVLALNTWVLLYAPTRLATWMPDGLAWGLSLAYAGSAFVWLALITGSLPLLAHRRATARIQEAPA